MSFCPHCLLLVGAVNLSFKVHPTLTWCDIHIYTFFCHWKSIRQNSSLHRFPLKLPSGFVCKISLSNGKCDRTFKLQLYFVFGCPVVTTCLWSTKTNFPSMAWRETYSVGFTRMSPFIGCGTIWGCNRPMATKQLRLQPSLSGSLSSSKPILVGGQLFRYPVLWMVQKLLRSAAGKTNRFKIVMIRNRCL